MQINDEFLRKGCQKSQGRSLFSSQIHFYKIHIFVGTKLQIHEQMEREQKLDENSTSLGAQFILP